jgi:hypothetical protein
MDSGAVEPIKESDPYQPTTFSAPISLFRYSSSVWLEATTDVDWIRYPVANDIYGRLIFADPSAGELRVTDASLVGDGSTQNGTTNVAAYRRLDVPPPAQGFSATLQGTADDADEVPETRYYVCTFVNSWGAEGPPSPASNQVEWRTGQTVLLEGLPAVPTGNYDIAYRRIYRINTGSTGTTNYQYVTEVATATATRNISAITQANPVVVTTATAHGLTDGQEVLFSGLGLAAAQDIVTPGILLSGPLLDQNPLRVYCIDHGFSTGDYVEFDGLDETTGMQELQGVRNAITFINENVFSLDGIDGTGYTRWEDLGNDTVAKVFGMDELNGNTYKVEVIDQDKFSLVGVDGTAYEAYRSGGTVGIVAGTSYTDTIPSGSLAEVLPTELYDPPNSATIGIVEHPAGFLVGFFGKTLCFSEPGAPHAWPIDYQLSTSHDIVGLGVFGNSVAVLTKGWPYIASGSDPSAMAMLELEIDQSCAAKRGIVDFGSAVAYPSPDGLILVSNQGVTNATAALFTREQWQALTPSSFDAYNWEQQYLCFYDNGTTQGAFVLDPFGPGNGVRDVSDYVAGGYRDIEEDQLYLIKEWDITAISPASTANDFLTTGHIAALDFGATGDYTIEFWARQPAGVVYADWQTLFNQNGSGTDGGWVVRAYNEGGGETGLEVAFDDGTTTFGFQAGFYQKFPDDGDFHHFAVVLDRTSDEVHMYADGVSVGGPYSGIPALMGNLDSGALTPFRMFTESVSNSTYWQGSLSEVRIWNSARSAAEIVANKDKPLAGTETGLVAYWPFNGADGTVVRQTQPGDTGVRVIDDPIFNYDLTIWGAFSYAAPGPIAPQNIELWDAGSNLQFTWKSKPTYTPNAVNMAAAKVVADDYPVEIIFYVDDVRRHTHVAQSSKAFRLPGGFKGEKFEVVIKSKKRVSDVAMATTMRELAVTV